MIEHAGRRRWGCLVGMREWHFSTDLRSTQHTAQEELNSFSDLVSRIAAKMGEIAAAKKTIKQSPAAHHMNAHSFGQEDRRDIPEAFGARNLRLSIDDGKEIYRAMMSNETKIHGEKMSDIYKCVTGRGELTAEKRIRSNHGWVEDNSP